MGKKKLGLAFADELSKVMERSGHFRKNRMTDQNWEDFLLAGYHPDTQQETISPWRLVILGSIFLISFFGLFLRLFHLQVVSGKEYRERADLNRVAIRVIHAPRGVIYDRNGRILAQNNPAFRLSLGIATKSAQLISRDAARLLEAKDDPLAADLEIDAIRFYPYGEITAHALGYVGEVSDEELKNHQAGDRIGRSGVEQIYESTLRGIDGAEIIEVNAQGKKLRTLRKIDPLPGQNIYLSLDVDLQKSAFDALIKGAKIAKSCCGVVVAMDPKSGDILALVSYPSFDANAFTDPSRNDEVSAFFNNPDSPLVNRVIGGTYPPGSTFKITSALAGLSSGKISAQTKIEDTGVINLGPYSFSNWYFTQYGSKEGTVDLVKALQRSNDIYFYRVGEWVGEQKLGDTAKSLGMGKKLGIDLPGEEAGLVPDDAWKQRTYDQVWYPGDSLHMAIGQGFLLTTPLQILAQTAFVAADGYLMKPHLVTKITSPEGEDIKKFKFDPIVKNIFSKEYIELVKKGLALVPKEGGTVWPFFNFSIPTAGKTGTAEFGDPKDRTHAWYTSYAPADDPQIVLTVLVEGGGEGSSVAAPIAKEIYTWYFNEDKNNLKSLNLAPASDSAKRLGE